MKAENLVGKTVKVMKYSSNVYGKPGDSELVSEGVYIITGVERQKNHGFTTITDDIYVSFGRYDEPIEYFETKNMEFSQGDKPQLERECFIKSNLESPEWKPFPEVV